MTVVAVALVAVAVVCLVAVVTVPTVRSWRFGDHPMSRRTELLIRYLWQGALAAMIGLGLFGPGGSSGSDQLVTALAICGGAAVVLGVTKSIVGFVLRWFVAPGSASRHGVPSKSRVSPLGSGLRPVQ